MNDNELKKMEQESAELLDLLREVRDEDNATITPRQCKPHVQKVRRTISPYWLVPHPLRRTYNRTYSSHWRWKINKESSIFFIIISQF